MAVIGLCPPRRGCAVPRLFESVFRDSGEKTQTGRWCRLLFLSVLLHAPLLYLPALKMQSTLPTMPLQVMLTSAMDEAGSPRGNQEASVAGVSGDSRAGRSVPGSSSVTGVAGLQPRPLTERPADAGQTPGESSGLYGHALAEARIIGRGTSPQTDSLPAGNLRAPASGGSSSGTREYAYADGRIKVVDGEGRVYCIKPPAEFVYATGGVLPRMGIPTTCP